MFLRRIIGIVCLILLFHCLVHAVYYPLSKIDSLEAAVEKVENGLMTLPDDELVDIYNKLANHYNERNTAKSLKLANKAIDLAEKIGYKEGVAHGTGMLGSLYNSKGKYDSAIYFYKKSLNFFEEKHDSLYMAKMYNNIGLSNDFLGIMDSAMYYYSKSLDIKKNLKDTMGIITCLNNIGASFFYYEMYDEAMDYYHQCIPLEEAIEDEEGLAMTYLNMGELFLKTRDYEQAKKNLLKAHEINKMVNSNYLQSMIWDNLALVFMNLGNINEARNCFERAIELNKILKDHEALSNNYLSMGKFMHQSGSLNKAVDYYSSAFNECTRSGFVKRASDAAKALSELYAQRTNYRKSLHYHLLYSDLKDSVINIENNRQMAEMKIKYETERKEKQLIQKKLELEQNAREIKQQRIVTGFSIVGGIVFLVFSLFIYGQYKRKDEAYRQLVKKNLDMVKCEQVQEINQQAGELEKSLKYNKSALSDDRKGRIARELQELIKTTKPYQDPTLGIDALATRLNTNRSYLSQIINEFYEQNFYSFINDMRVKEARRLLANPEYRKLSIEGIARQVGFNSKSSFNAAFKKFTGVTPSYFSKTIQEEENFS